MTEEAWLSLKRPHRMLRHVGKLASERQLRLIAVACNRWSYPVGGQTEAVLLAVERLADGIETTDDLSVLTTLPEWDRRNWNQAGAVTVADMRVALPSHRSNEDERVAQCNFIRDIFPFHPITLSPSWLTSTVVSLANQMYESRDFSAMPILADALQDADCSNETILTHCRGPGPHVRGCWAIDLLTGRE
jgi:hypothetical protein